MDVLDNILDRFQLFEKTYHHWRIVDPVSKKVLDTKTRELSESNVMCHDFWQKEKNCSHCISMHASTEKDTFYKIGHKGGSVFLVTAIPVSVEEKSLVVELIKDVTNRIYLEVGEHCGEFDLPATNEYLNEAVVKDELTDLYNRRYLNKKLLVELKNSSAKNEPLSIIFADLDFFKEINDTYGHTAGDHVLREFSMELKKHIRSGKDWIARYGGEEFIICLPNTGSDTARIVAERIRKSIMNRKFTVRNKKINVTCSFGVHTVCGEEECLTVDGIIDLADQKLYQAKNAGRNKVI